MGVLIGTICPNRTVAMGAQVGEINTPVADLGKAAATCD